MAYGPIQALLSSIKWRTAWLMILLYLNLMTNGQITSTLSPSAGINEVRQGQILLGGLFPAHIDYDPSKELCQTTSIRGIEQAFAMMYAIEKINNATHLLPNITLGYHIRDSCSSVRHTLKNLINFIPYTQDLVTDSIGYNLLNKYGCNMTSIQLDKNNTLGVAAVVGPSTSPTTMPSSNVLGVFNIPAVSYGASSSVFVDRTEYDNLYRTLPSDQQQARAIADLIDQFGWTYIATLSVDDIYNRLLMGILQRRLRLKNICVAQESYFPATNNTNTIRTIVRQLTELSNVSVIVLIASEKAALSVLQEAIYQGLTEKIWIGTKGWSDSPEVLQLPSNIIGGLFGVIPRNKPPHQFYQYFRYHLQQNDHPALTQLVEAKLNCRFSQNTCKLVESTNNDLQNCQNSAYYVNAEGNQVDFVIDAVNAIATALHQSLGCNANYCPSFTHFDRKAYLDALKNVQIENAQGMSLTFNNKGEITRNYSITNIQFDEKNPNCGYVVSVGTWYENRLSLDYNLVRFQYGISKTIPSSRCSFECELGYRRVRPDSQSCCWQCEKCSKGEVSNGTTVYCVACGLCEQPVANNSYCIPIPVTRISWDHPVCIAVLVGTFITVALTTFVAVVFLKYRETPIVKASNRLLSTLHIISVYYILAVAPAFVYEPNDVVCEVQFIIFATSITFCMAILLTKTNSVSKIFQIRMKNFRALGGKSKNRESHMQLLFIFGLTSVSVIIVIVGSILDIPRAREKICKGTEAFSRCESDTHLGITFSAVYFCLLGTICAFLAWRTRNLPNNFNEAKYICFCAICMWMICILTIPGYYGTDGVLRAVFSSLGVTCFALCVLVFLFLPKVYTILFKPELNTKEHCMKSISQYTFRKASAVPIGGTRSSISNAGIHTPSGSSPASPQIISKSSISNSKNQKNGVEGEKRKSVVTFTKDVIKEEEEENSIDIRVKMNMQHDLEALNDEQVEVLI